MAGGENFQAIRNKYHNQIDVSQMATPERVLVLYGDENRAMSILADALPVMALNQGVRPGFVELRAMIHSSQAGAVIVSDSHRLIIGHCSLSRRAKVVIASKNFVRSTIWTRKCFLIRRQAIQRNECCPYAEN